MNTSKKEISERKVLTVSQFSREHPAFTQSALRNLIYKSEDRPYSAGVIKGNGLNKSLIRVGRRILIDVVSFFQWLDGQKGGQSND